MSAPTLWKIAPGGKPMRRGSIIADADIHLWGWSAALLGWCAEGNAALPQEIEWAQKGLAYLAQRMRESVRVVTPLRCEVA